MVNHDKKDLKMLCLQQVTLSPVNLPATGVYLLRGSLQLSQHSVDYYLETKLSTADKILKTFFCECRRQDVPFQFRKLFAGKMAALPDVNNMDWVPTMKLSDRAGRFVIRLC